MVKLKPYFQRDGIQLFLGDCREVAPTLGLFESVITDPPYGLGFMGKKWDQPGSMFERQAEKKNGFDHVGGNHNPINSRDRQRTQRTEGHKFQGWSEDWASAVLQACLPGAMLLAFGGTRTFHRLACAIEDAQWEIRDCLMWLTGQGFPKSLDISKAIDKAAGREREVVAFGKRTINTFNDRLQKSSGYRPRQYQQRPGEPFEITVAASRAAKQFSGYGTALKPAWEPIILAMKPLDGTFANNAIEHGVAGLNIDGCRIGSESTIRNQHDGPQWSGKFNGGDRLNGSSQGRFPANLILSHHLDCVCLGMKSVKNHGHGPAARGKGGISTNGHNGQNGLVERRQAQEQVEAWECHQDCPVRLLDEQSGPKMHGAGYATDGEHCPGKKPSGGVIYGLRDPHATYRVGDSGGASRFFKTCLPDDICFLCGTLYNEHVVKSDTIKGHKSCGAKSAESNSNRKPRDADSVLASASESGRRNSAGKSAKSNASAKVVERNSSSSLGTNGSSVQTNAGGTVVERIARNASCAAKLCRKCATDFARALVAIRCSGSKNGGSRHTRDSIEKSRSYSRILSLASCAASQVGIDTIPTIQSLSKLFGSVVPAIANFISWEGVERAEVVNDPEVATRFLYSPKASRRERGEGNTHPCVKPLSLLSYLCRLTRSPTGGRVLDPFAGSGSTLIAAHMEGREAVGIEMSREYCEISRDRIKAYLRGELKAKPSPKRRLAHA